METWLGWGSWQMVPFRLGLVSAHRGTACFCFVSWGSAEIAREGKALRFKGLKDTDMGDLEGSKLQEALHDLVTKHRLGARQPGFICHGYHYYPCDLWQLA